MAFSHLRRIAAALTMIFGVSVLALIIDAVAYPMWELGAEEGVQEGPFSAVHSLAGSVMWWIVAILLVGIMIWVLIGPIQTERREERQRRIR